MGEMVEESRAGEKLVNLGHLQKRLREPLESGDFLWELSDSFLFGETSCLGDLANLPFLAGALALY